MYVIQLINYTAAYRGNFFRSLEALEADGKIKNLYLFCAEARQEKAQSWIRELDMQDRIFYMSGDVKSDTALIKDLIKTYEPAAIHMHFCSREHFDAARRAAGSGKVRLIRHFHNHSAYGSKGVKSALRRFLFRRFVMIGCSESVAESVKHDFPGNEVYTVVNSIDFSRLDTDKTGTAPVRDMNRLIMLGFDYQRKGVDLALHAVDKLRRQGKAITLDIVFASNNEKNIKKICEELGTDSVPKWIRILAPSDNVAEYFRGAGLFLSPSREEGFCYAIAEAAYCGCRVVASDTPGQLVHMQIPDISWFKSGDAESLSEAIDRALNTNTDGPEYDRIRKALTESYDLGRWVREVSAVYE